MVNVARQPSLSEQMLLPPHYHINFHSAGEKGFVLAILQQNGKPLERLMNLPLSDNSTDHLTTNAISPVIWSSGDKCCILAKVLWQNDVLIDSVPCASLSGPTWELFRNVFDKLCRCICREACKLLLPTATIKLASWPTKWGQNDKEPQAMIKPLQHALSPVVNDPQGRSPKLHLKQYHHQNPCYGVSTTGQIKSAVNNRKTNDGGSSLHLLQGSACLSMSCLQDASRTLCSGRKHLNHDSVPWMAWHSRILGHSRPLVEWTTSWLARIFLVGSSNPAAHKVSISKSLVTDVSRSCDILPQGAKDHFVIPGVWYWLSTFITFIIICVSIYPEWTRRTAKALL